MAQDSTQEQPGQDGEQGRGWGDSQRARGPRRGSGRGKSRPGGDGAGSGGGGPGVRLQRVLADAGVASRRDCEALIEAGRVRVNGQMVRVLPVFVDPENDSIDVDGRPIGKPERRLYLLLNKPERVLTTVDDSSEFAGTGTARMTVLDLVDHPAKARLFPVGRLDFATRGLVLLTNDGELANRLTHPRYGVPKVYEAVVKGRVSDEQLAELRKLVSKQERQDSRKKATGGEGGGGTGGGGGPRIRSRAEVELIDSGPGETTIRLVLRERTGYPLRKLIVSAGCPVKKLTRVAMGPLELTGVREGQWREITRAELMLLRRDPRRAPAKPDERGVDSTGPGAQRGGGGMRGSAGPARGRRATPPAFGRPSPAPKRGRGGPGGRDGERPSGKAGRGERDPRGGPRGGPRGDTRGGPRGDARGGTRGGPRREGRGPGGTGGPGGGGGGGGGRDRRERGRSRDA